MHEEFKFKKTYLETEICALSLSCCIVLEKSSWRWLFLSLKNSDITEVVLEFEQLLYDVCGVFGRFFWTELARCKRFKDFDFKAQEWRFCGQLWLFKRMRFSGLVYTKKLLALYLANYFSIYKEGLRLEKTQILKSHV